MSYNWHWHKRPEKRKALEEALADCLTVQVKPEALEEIYKLVSENMSAINSERAFARYAGIAWSTWWDAAHNADKGVSLGTLAKIGKLALPWLRQKGTDWSPEEFAERILSTEAFKQELVEHLRRQ